MTKRVTRRKRTKPELIAEIMALTRTGYEGASREIILKNCMIFFEQILRDSSTSELIQMIRDMKEGMKQCKGAK